MTSGSASMARMVSLAGTLSTRMNFDAADRPAVGSPLQASPNERTESAAEILTRVGIIVVCGNMATFTRSAFCFELIIIYAMRAARVSGHRAEM